MKINVKEIPCYVSIGIHDEEKKMGQNLLIDLSVEINPSKAIKSDSVDNTVNYVDLYKIVQKIGKSKSFSLIETFAENLLESILKYSPIIKSAKVTVYKPHIPFPEFQGKVSIEVEGALCQGNLIQ